MPRFPYHVTTEDLGPIARKLRERKGRSLTEAAELIGVDFSNLSKAERGSTSYAGIAARAIQYFAQELAREKGRKDPERIKVRATYRLPSNVSDVVDELRAPDRERRLNVVLTVFGAAGFEIVSDTGDPAYVELAWSGMRFKVDLDSLSIRSIPYQLGLPFRFGSAPPSEGEEDEAHLRRVLAFMQRRLSPQRE